MKILAMTFTALFSIFIGFLIMNAIFLFHDFVLNAHWNNSIAKHYGIYGQGILIAEAPKGITNDLMHKHSALDEKIIGTYYDHSLLGRPVIKYAPGNESVLPHELGHKWWYRNMTEEQRRQWCSTFNYEIWSYDSSCEEGFAEWFGEAVILPSTKANLTVLDINRGIIAYNLTHSKVLRAEVVTRAEIESTNRVLYPVKPRFSSAGKDSRKF